MGALKIARFAEFFHLLWRNHKAYVLLTVIYYGLVLGGTIWVSHHPGLTSSWRTSIRGNFNQSLIQAYDRGDVLPAIYLTFLNNFFLASLAAITLPSLLIPFWGLLIGAVWAILWGVALTPSDPSYGLKIIPHSFTGLLEGQGYILAMLAVYLLWHNFFWPRRIGAATRREGYMQGLRQTAVLYTGMFVLLSLVAVYEALVAIYLVPVLQHAG